MVKAFLAKLMGRKQSNAAHKFPASRKHIRITYGAFDASIAYYGHNGRKVTRVNNIRFAALPAVIQSARNLGYRKV